MASGSGWNLWVWLAGWWVESMGVASGCGCKEVCHIIYPSPLVSALFLQQHPFLFIKKMFSLLVCI